MELGYHALNMDWQQLEREALRLHARYTTEVVEELGLCPWALDARHAGRVHTHVSRSREPELAPSLEVLGALAQNDSVDVAFIVYPLLDLDRLAFAHFVADLRVADAARYAVGASIFALADFHPNADIDLASAERLVPFLRRTPDPTLQIVRRSALHDVRMSEDQGTQFLDLSQFPLEKLASVPSPPPPLAARVANNNLRTVTRMGTAALSERLKSILDDRYASYSALGLPLPLWKAHR